MRRVLSAALCDLGLNLSLIKLSAGSLVVFSSQAKG